VALIPIGGTDFDTSCGGIEWVFAPMNTGTLYQTWVSPSTCLARTNRSENAGVEIYRLPAVAPLEPICHSV
jgi:hypothetical protein